MEGSSSPAGCIHFLMLVWEDRTKRKLSKEATHEIVAYLVTHSLNPGTQMDGVVLDGCWIITVSEKFKEGMR